MGRYRILDQQGFNYVTCTVVGWIDVFSRKQYRDIVLDSLAYCRREKGLMIFGYVLMSNHLHMIVQVKPGTKQELSEILRDFKKYTATRILDAIEKGPESRKEWLMHMFKYFAKYNSNNREHQFWQQDNHPIALYSPAVIWQKLDYIHANPVRNGLVDNAEDYVYSSARNYLRDNKNCLLEVDLLELLPPTGAGYVYVPMDFK
jgi:REP element-mobilizing transposase RayT